MTRVTLKEIERILEITDALGLSREALTIPLRTRHPGGVRKLPNGTYEIVVDAKADFEQWLSWLRSRLSELGAAG
jgi:hypothetical protein